MNSVDVIDRLYDELRVLAKQASTPENEARYQVLWKQLLDYEYEDGRCLRKMLAMTSPIRPGEFYSALREARELLAQYG